MKMSKCKIFVNVLCYRTILSKARALILSWFYGNISLMIMLYPEKQWLEEHEVGLQTVCFFYRRVCSFSDTHDYRHGSQNDFCCHWLINGIFVKLIFDTCWTSCGTWISIVLQYRQMPGGLLWVNYQILVGKAVFYLASLAERVVVSFSDAVYESVMEYSKLGWKFS